MGWGCMVLRIPGWDCGPRPTQPCALKKLRLSRPLCETGCGADPPAVTSAFGWKRLSVWDVTVWSSLSHLFVSL